MGDGGDDGGMVDYSAADLPVDFGTDAVEVAEGAPGDDFDDVIVIPADVGGEPGRLPSEEDDIIEMTWVEPDTRSGP